MSRIGREFFVSLNQPSLFIKNLLPKAHSRLISIHYLEIPRAPSVPSRNIKNILPPAAWQFLPTPELALILRAAAHGFLVILLPRFLHCFQQPRDDILYRDAFRISVEVGEEAVAEDGADDAAHVFA